MKQLESPFVNDMFAMVWLAFQFLYPDKECECSWVPTCGMDEKCNVVHGATEFNEDGVFVYIDAKLSVFDAIEVFAHELAHVAVGIEHGHDEEWAKAFDNIQETYDRIGDILFGDEDE